MIRINEIFGPQHVVCILRIFDEILCVDKMHDVESVFSVVLDG